MLPQTVCWYRLLSHVYHIMSVSKTDSQPIRETILKIALRRREVFNQPDTVHYLIPNDVRLNNFRPRLELSHQKK